MYCLSHQKLINGERHHMRSYLHQPLILLMKDESTADVKGRALHPGAASASVQPCPFVYFFRLTFRSRDAVLLFPFLLQINPYLSVHLNPSNKSLLFLVSPTLSACTVADLTATTELDRDVDFSLCDLGFSSASFRSKVAPFQDFTPQIRR